MTDAPDFTTPILAAREWWQSWGGTRGALFSPIYSGDAWPVSSPLVAKCHPYLEVLGEKDFSGDPAFLAWLENRRTHISPVEECYCGIYALARPRLWWRLRKLTVVGTVRLWGRVIPAEHGWRAQYAAIDALVLRHPFDRRTRQAARAYGVPVLWRWPHLTKLEEVIG